MMGAALLILGSYLAISPGVDSFLLPKLVCISLGALLCLCSSPVPVNRFPRFRALFAFSEFVSGITVLAAESPIQASWGLYRSPTAGMLGVVACWLSYEAGEADGNAPRAWRLVVYGSTICAVVALLQLLPNAPFHSVLPSGRAIGLIGSPPFLGCMLALALPLTAAGYFGESLILVAALIAARSKAALIGAVLGGATSLVLSRRGEGESERSSTTPTYALVGTAIAVICWTLNRSASDAIRLYTWRTAIKAFLARPLLGWGPDNFIDAFMRLRDRGWMEAAGGNPGAWQTASENAHNLVLNLLATQGVAGVMAHGFLALGVGRALSDAVKRGSPQARTLCAAYVAVFVYSLFNPVPFPAWCVLSFLLGTMRL